VQSPSGQAIARYQAELDVLAGLIPMARVRWFLEGGLALAACLGRFLRQHSDVDIGLLETDLYRLESMLKSSGYRLFSRNPSWHPVEYLPFDLVRATSADEIVSGKRVKRLTAIKVDGQGKVDWRAAVLPRFDIHVHRPGPGVVYLTRKQVPFPADMFHRQAVYRTPGGLSIRVASIPFQYFFKLVGRQPRQHFDRQTIEQYGLISPEDAERVRALVPGAVRQASLPRLILPSRAA
jgi:hypothetical protein